MATTTLTSGNDRTASDLNWIAGHAAEGVRARMAMNMLRLGRSFGDAAELAGLPVERVVEMWKAAAATSGQPHR